MVITDSRTRDVARPVFLTFAMAGPDGEASAHVVPDGAGGRGAARGGGAKPASP